jgi:hypothetical protein
MKRQNQCGAGMAATLRVRLLAGASPDAPAAEVDHLGRRTASPAVTLVVHVHALAAPHAVDGLAELRRIDRARSDRSGYASAAAGCHRTSADISRRHAAGCADAGECAGLPQKVVPEDTADSVEDPALWDAPTARLSATGCSPTR